MRYNNLLAVQIGLLTIAAIYYRSVLMYVGCLLVSVLQRRYRKISVVMIICCGMMILWYSMNVYNWILVGTIDMLVYFGNNNEQHRQLDIHSTKYIVPLFLIFVGMISVHPHVVIKAVHLGVFCVAVVGYYVNWERGVFMLLQCCRVGFIVEGCLFAYFAIGMEEYESGFYERNDWFGVVFPFVVFGSTILVELSTEHKEHLSSSNIHRQSYNNNELESENNLSQQLLIHESPSLENITTYHYQPEESSASSEEEELNLLLLIPFCNLGGGIIVLPIYIYFFMLQYGRHGQILFIIMFVFVCMVVYEADFRLGEDVYSGVMLRVFMVLMANKNISGSIEVGEIVKTVWLKSSFGVVLGLLFWFSLITVNMFHLVFIVILLLFITKDSGRQNTESYRHRHWGYLLALFNFFLVLRVVYALMVYYSITLPLNSELMKSMVALTGIPYRYSESIDEFNLIPLLVGAAIGLQSLTYSSSIYSRHRTHNLVLPAYRETIELLLRGITIVYYKLVPWLSYALVMFFLLLLDYSVSSCLLLAWLLITISQQILFGSKVENYQRLYWLWLVYLRLTALQIVLRYVFEFAKFDIIYVVLEKVPFFQVLVQYQELLGLVIRGGDYVYFKTITKFQLMIAVDFMAIFVAFLVTEYYTLLIKHNQIIQTSEAEPLTEDQQRVEEIYNNYIDFKLTEWLEYANLTDMIRMMGEIYLEIYFPIIGLFCTWYYAVTMFMYLIVCIKYYLALNMLYYRTYVETKLKGEVLEEFVRWREIKVGWEEESGEEREREIENGMIVRNEIEMKEMTKEGQENNENIGKLKQKILNSIEQIQLAKIELHDSLRKWILLITVLSIILRYLSKIFTTEEISSLVSNDTIIMWRWMLYVGGCSIESGWQSHASKVVLVLIVLELKCCWLVRNRRGKRGEDGGESGGSSKKDEKVEKENEKMLIGEVVNGSLRHNSELNHITSLENIEHKDSHSLAKLSEQAESDNVNALSDFKYKEMQGSLYLGSNKIIERAFVMALVFSSIIESQHPFGMIYLLCAFLLNYLGELSIKSLSRVLTCLVLLEYLLILANYTNKQLFPITIPEFTTYQQTTILNTLFHLSPEWEKYFTFGKSEEELLILPISFMVMLCYKLYFTTMRNNWLRVLMLIQKKIVLSRIQRVLYAHLVQIYNLAVIYSPLCLSVLCLAIYLLDYTTTNLFLSILSILFLFLSFLWLDYSESKEFLKGYFFILQVMIVFFMLVYSLLSIPMYKSYCNRILCSPEEFHTQFYKAILLFVLQIGIDLMGSEHFAQAMVGMRSAKKKSEIFKLAIAYKHNDKKIRKIFEEMQRGQRLEREIKTVVTYLSGLKKDSEQGFSCVRQIVDESERVKDIVLKLLPSFIDFSLIMTAAEAKEYVMMENRKWMMRKNIGEDILETVNSSYQEEFWEIEDMERLERRLKRIVEQGEEEGEMERNKRNGDEERDNERIIVNDEVGVVNGELNNGVINCISPEKERNSSLRSSRARSRSSMNESQHRKSYIEGKLPMERPEIYNVLLPAQSPALLSTTKETETHKTQLLYLELLQAVLSNWHYLTYLLCVLEHIRNIGFLTLPLAVITFCLGVPSSYQAGKYVWRALFLLVLLPIGFKFALKINLVELQPEIVYLLIGDNYDSILLEYLIVVFILIQCLILKMVGLYEESVEEVECMRMALIRNIINNDQPEELQCLYQMLHECPILPSSSTESMFSRSECKPGYDYSTLMTSLQLILIVFIFLCYDHMAIRKDITFYEMMEYNQFTSGMVVLTLVQLVFLLVERFVSIADMKECYEVWDVTLIIKYGLMVATMGFVGFTVLVFFPVNSDKFESNLYIEVFYALYCLSFFVSALQVKYGIDQQSKGFMDRYTWYNGFIYMGFRAVPFLFEFKVFSDWTFTKTSLRIFDWIRLEEIYGRLYVAKCNSLFLQGKQLGSKIEWWKKLLMGYPLLFAIILLLFGPLVLFSSLNPLASSNAVSAGYLELTLKINKTNEYPFYTNSHITDIHFLNATIEEQKLLKTYDIEPETVQIIHLEEYSDQYWEISEGSYYKLLGEPEASDYELVLRVKFDRNMTGLTPVYILNSYKIPREDVDKFKKTLIGEDTFTIVGFIDTFIRLDNNNGIHVLGEEKGTISFRAEKGKKVNKEYWVIDGGLDLKVASDKYTKAIFGYSVMSFYISIILVIANYFRFLFQGSAHTIIMSDIPVADPMLTLCDGIYQARRNRDIAEEERLFWTLIDLMRSPDNIKLLTGDYLDARLQTLKKME